MGVNSKMKMVIELLSCIQEKQKMCSVEFEVVEEFVFNEFFSDLEKCFVEVGIKGGSMFVDDELVRILGK